MKNIIACLGFNPNDDGVVQPILEARLKDAIRLSRENPGSRLILMGGNTFRNQNLHSPDLAVAMKKYLEEQAVDILPNTEIILNKEGTSTVRELAVLREMLEKESEAKLSIIASEFFVERVKLCAEYIFNNPENIDFVASEVPEEGREGFKEIEEMKLKKGHEWLDGREKGDYRSILSDQTAYEERIMRGEVDHPVSKAFKPR